MESAKTEVDKKLEALYWTAYYDGMDDLIIALRKTLALKDLHADFAMNRVIHGTIKSVLDGMQQALTEQRNEQCQRSTSTNPTNTSNSSS